MLFAVYLYENVIEVEGIALTTMISPQAPRVRSSRFGTPEANRFSGYNDAPFSQEIVDIAMAGVAR